MLSNITSSAKDHEIAATCSINTLLEVFESHVVSHMSDAKIVCISCADALIPSIESCLPSKKTYVLTYHGLAKQYTSNQENIKGECSANSDSILLDHVSHRVFNALFEAAMSGKTIFFINFLPENVKLFSSCKRYYVYSPGAPCEQFRLVTNDYIGVTFTKKNIKHILLDILPSSEKLGIISGVRKVGLDVSMGSTGIAAVSDSGILIGSFRSKPGDNDFIRGQAARNYLCPMLMRNEAGNACLVNLLSCHDFAVEGGALDAVRGAYRLGRYCGMLLSAFEIKSILEIAPASLKKHVTGYGRADKAAVKKFACNKLGINYDIVKNDDEGDALALLYCLTHLDAQIFSKKTKKKRA